MKRFSFFFLVLLLISCGTGSGSSALQPVSVYATEAASSWLVDLYDCSVDLEVTLRVSTESPEILLRLAEPDETTTFAYQVGVEELLIVAHEQSLIQDLTLAQAHQIFTGQGDPSLQVWAYDSLLDVQSAFELVILNGGRVTSFARLANDPAQMSEALSADVNAIGILPRHWLGEGLRELLVVASVPVLAVTSAAPEGIVSDLIACLQKE